MVEFKEMETGELVLMEINPRPWGSMALPVSLGVDFPKWAVELGLGIRDSFDSDYEQGRYFAWLLPNCFLNLLVQPWGLAFLVGILGKHRCGTEIELRDIGPLWGQCREALYEVKRLMETGTFRFPQGRVVQND